MIGRIQYFLPGMFEANPIPKIVNAQLWTVPRELDGYLILFGFGLLAFIRKTSLLVLAGYALSVLAITYSIMSHPGARVLNELGQVTGRALILCFLAGCVLYTLRESVPHSLTLFAIATIAFVLLLYSRAGESLLGLPAAYMTAFLGLTNFRKIRLIVASDYSYGIYLYGFAIQQCVARFGQVFRHWYVEFPLSLTIVTIVAAVSWHFVEKPALSLRRYLSIPGFGAPRSYACDRDACRSATGGRELTAPEGQEQHEPEVPDFISRERLFLTKSEIDAMHIPIVGIMSGASRPRREILWLLDAWLNHNPRASGGPRKFFLTFSAVNH